MSEGRYYLVSARRTGAGDRNVAFWRPDCQGYCTELQDAGTYTAAEIAARPAYFNNGVRTFAVAAAEAESLSESLLVSGANGTSRRIVRNTPVNVAGLAAAGLRAAVTLDPVSRWDSAVPGRLASLAETAEDADLPSLWELRGRLCGMIDAGATEEALEEAFADAVPRSAPSPRG